MRKEMVRFSIVMPVYLGYYKTAAKDREKKFIRAVSSVLAQTHPLWELLIISDGCEKSVQIAHDNNLLEDNRVKMFKIKRGSLWGGSPRNTGIKKATGEYVIYLDADDEYRSNYLRNLSDEMLVKEADWYVVDDLIYDKNEGYVIRKSHLLHRGKCGTSNIIHKPTLNVFWPESGTYAHDFVFINILRATSNNYHRIPPVGYVVQHIPGLYDR